MNKYNEAYIKACKEQANAKEIVAGFWNDLASEVDYYLSENTVMSAQEACEAVINDSYWGSFHIQMLSESFFMNDLRAGIFWEHFLEGFEELWKMKHRNYF